ncbi:unnamed protein product [Closterium sp. NIES-65]|nr:unnamed protein product [Closterium sp. NIES-65]CAI6002444.1 unnamed protein product [Closterium sp. NIES-65]
MGLAASLYECQRLEALNAALGKGKMVLHDIARLKSDLAAVRGGGMGGRMGAGRKSATWGGAARMGLMSMGGMRGMVSGMGGGGRGIRGLLGDKKYWSVEVEGLKDCQEVVE